MAKTVAGLEAELERLNAEYDHAPQHEADWRYDQIQDVIDQLADARARASR